MNIRPYPAGLALGIAILAVCIVPFDAIAQRARTTEEIANDIAEYRKALLQLQDEYNALEKQRDAAIAAYVGSSIPNPVPVGVYRPGVPSRWEDFSICDAVNSDPGSAMLHYQQQMDIAKANVTAGENKIAALRKEMQQARANASKVKPSPPSSPTLPTQTAKPTPPASPTPKKDMGCLCRCACAAAGFNVRNVRSYYSTSPVRHMNPNGSVSESCMNPSEGPCVCQGFVCRRAPLAGQNACTAECTK